MNLGAKAGVKSATIGIQVIRADGTVEDYGTVSRYHSSPLMRLLFAVLDRSRVLYLKRQYRRA